MAIEDMGHMLHVPPICIIFSLSGCLEISYIDKLLSDISSFLSLIVTFVSSMVFLIDSRDLIDSWSFATFGLPNDQCR